MIAIGLLLVLSSLVGVNSIYASAIAFVVVAGIIWFQRPDLIQASLIGMLAWILLTAVGYHIILLFWPTIFAEWWLWSNISGITILQIPIEEFIWFSTWGLVGSVVYEWKHDFRFERISS